jgi:hypothetical protein
MGDRLLAEELLKSVLLISRDDFADKIRELILEKADATPGVIALYAERELRQRNGVPDRLFKESRRKIKRAEGVMGPLAVKPTKGYDHSVGSEGIVAQLISELAKAYPEKFLDHPGPERIRRREIRAFWVVTDFVGSGDRVGKYLTAAWRVRSIRSWWSGKFLRFAVLAYGSTELGEKIVRSHPSKPDVLAAVPAPTIRTVFSPLKAEKMERLCATYNPSKKSTVASWGNEQSPLGYLGTGALMVFSHGAPNNMPLIFHKFSQSNKRPWVPLFPSRVSAGIDSSSFGVALTPERLQQRLAKLGEKKMMNSRVVNAKLPTREVFALLTALSKPPRLRDLVLSRRSGLDTTKVRHLCAKMTEYGWLDSQRKLTDAGVAQLLHAKKQIDNICQFVKPPTVHFEPIPYYPKSLRPPV